MFQKADNAMQSDVLKGFQIVHCQALPANRALPGYATESKTQGVTATRSHWPEPQPLDGGALCQETYCYHKLKT